MAGPLMRLFCALGFHLGLVEMARLVLIRCRIYHDGLRRADMGNPAWQLGAAPIRHVWHEERFLRCWCGRTPEAAC